MIESGFESRIAVVTADPALFHRIAQVLRRLDGFALTGAARTREEMHRLLRQSNGLSVIVGATELRWLDEVPKPLVASAVRAVIVVTPALGLEEQRQLIMQGAVAVVGVDAVARELPQALAMVRGGMVWLPVAVMSTVARSLVALEQGAVPPSRVSEVSAREAEVITLAAKGFSNREIAERLGIATKTVETYKHRVKLRFNLEGRRDLVALAVREGLLRRATPSFGRSLIPVDAAS